MRQVKTKCLLFVCCNTYIDLLHTMAAEYCRTQRYVLYLQRGWTTIACSDNDLFRAMVSSMIKLIHHLGLCVDQKQYNSITQHTFCACLQNFKHHTREWACHTPCTPDGTTAGGLRTPADGC